MPDGTRCPHLQKDNLCGIYKKRFIESKEDFEIVHLVAIGNKPFQPFICGKIEKVIERNLLPPSVRGKCCYENESVLCQEQKTQ